MDTKKIFFLSVVKTPLALSAPAKEMGISFHSHQLQDGTVPQQELLSADEPDIVLTDVASISRIKQQVTYWTKNQKPVLVLGMTGKSTPHEDSRPPRLSMRNGMIFCQKISDMLSLTKAFCAPFQVQDPGVTILTNSGSLGILASDLCETEGLYLTIPDSTMLQQLQVLLSRHVPLYNPIQLPLQTKWETLLEILSSMLAARRTANLLFLLTPAGTAWEHLSQKAEQLVSMIQNSQIPVHLCLVSPESGKQAKKIFLQAGLPCYDTPECAVQSIRILFDFYAQKSKSKAEVK